MANTHSLVLNGSNQYATISDASQTGLDITGDLTIEAWVNKSATGADTVCGKYQDASSAKSYSLAVNTTRIDFRISEDGSSEDYLQYSPGTALSLNTWYHIAVTWDASASTATFYINGESVGTDTTTYTSLYDTAANFSIGRLGSSAQGYFDGLIDEVRVWNDVRTEAEIQDNLGVELVGTEANLQGYWKLNNDYTDETANGNDLTPITSPVFTTEIPFESPTSMVDSTKVLDLEASSSQYASITDASQTGLDITGDLTIEAWVKYESISSYQVIVTKFVAGAGKRSYRLDTSSSEIFFTISSDGSADTIYSNAWTIETERWYHIAVTYVASSGVIKYYQDGVRLGLDIATQNSIWDGDADFAVGASYGGSLMDGLMREVRVFSSERTQAEIVADARTTNVTDANLEGEWVLNDSYADTSGNGNTLTASGSPVFVNRPFNVANGLQGYWTLNESSGTRADSTANGNDLTDNNTVLSATGKQSNAGDFEATNTEYLSIIDASQTGLDITGDLSISTWIKPESTANQAIISKWSGVGSQSYKLEYNATTTTFQFYNAAGSFYFYNPSFIPVVGTWYHLVFTYDASAGLISAYIDGIPVGTKTVAGTDIKDTSVPFAIGADTVDGTAANFVDGLADETAIWNKVLTFGEVQDLYAQGAAIPYAAAGTGNALSMSNF